MLTLKPNCECCDVDLAADSTDARICSYECTFCKDCAENNFQGSCPNCTGGFVPRPIRPAKFLEKNPASQQRFLNQNHAHIANFGSKSRAS